MLLMNRDKERQRDEKIERWRFCRGGEIEILRGRRMKTEKIRVVKWGMEIKYEKRFIKLWVMKAGEST